MNRDLYDRKIIVLDLNFLEIEQRTIDDQIYTKKLLGELTGNQNIVIATDNAYFEAIKGVEQLGLKAGYLISNSGSTITNISNQKNINNGFINVDIAGQICNSCVWNNLYFSIVTDDARYPFHLNYWLIKKYKSDLSYLYKHKSNTLRLTPEIKEILKKFPVRKLEIYFLQRDLNRRKKEMMKFISFFQHQIDYSINISTLHILPKNNTKLNGINMIIKFLELDISLEKDGIYMAIDQYDRETAQNSQFPLIRHQLKDDLNEEEIKGVEILPMIEISGIKGFYNHEHLGNGDSEGKIKRALNNYKDYTVVHNSIVALENGKTKGILLEKESKNTGSVEKTQLNFGPQQIPQAISLLKKYSLQDRKI